MQSSKNAELGKLPLKTGRKGRYHTVDKKENHNAVISDRKGPTAGTSVEQVRRRGVIEERNNDRKSPAGEEKA